MYANIYDASVVTEIASHKFISIWQTMLVYPITRDIHYFATIQLLEFKCLNSVRPSGTYMRQYTLPSYLIMTCRLFSTHPLSELVFNCAHGNRFQSSCKKENETCRLQNGGHLFRTQSINRVIYGKIFQVVGDEMKKSLDFKIGIKREIHRCCLTTLYLTINY